MPSNFPTHFAVYWKIITNYKVTMGVLGQPMMLRMWGNTGLISALCSVKYACGLHPIWIEPYKPIIIYLARTAAIYLIISHQALNQYFPVKPRNTNFASFNLKSCHFFSFGNFFWLRFICHCLVACMAGSMNQVIICYIRRTLASL